MFGLTQLEHVLQPKSTLEKLLFLIENAFTRAHELTTLISFGALGVLVALRTFKQAFKKLSLLGQDESQLIDCGEVIPVPPPPASNAHFPAGLTQDDVQQAVSVTPNSLY